MSGFADRLWGAVALLAFATIAVGGGVHVYAQFVKAPDPLRIVLVVLGAFAAALSGFFLLWGLVRLVVRALRLLARGLCRPGVVIPALGVLLSAAALVYVLLLFSSRAEAWWGRVVLILGAPVLLFLLPRYLHLAAAFVRVLRNRRPWRGQASATPSPYEQVLPGQRKLIDDLLQGTGADVDHPIAPHAKTIALKAGWGMGKTACLRAFEHRVMAPVKGLSPHGVVVWFDCWRHQADSQPEFSLYWEMAQSWRMLWPFGWLFVPALRIYLTLLPVIAKATLDIGKAKVELDDKALREVPRALFWQRHLEALVRMAVVRYGRVVVVMEDIDRCTVPAAQAYVTLVRRFLSVPGLSTIVPFVEEQFRPKVFNPLCGQLPDLAATTDAVLWQWYGHTLATVPEASSGDANAPPPRSPIDAAFAAYTPKAEDKPAEKEKASDNVMQLLRPALLRRFATARNHERERIYAFLEDKYLYDHVLHVPPLGPDDFAQLTVDSLADRSEWVAIAPRGDGAVAPNWARMAAVVSQHFKYKVLPAPGAPCPKVTPRQFNGALSQALQDFGSHLEPMQGVVDRDASPHPAAGRLAAMLAHMAYHLAATRTRLHEPGAPS